MKPNYVLIDYENIQLDTAEVLAAPHFKILMFVGASQPRVGIGIANAMQIKGTDARYIRISAAGMRISKRGRSSAGKRSLAGGRPLEFHSPFALFRWMKRHST